MPPPPASPSTRPSSLLSTPGRASLSLSDGVTTSGGGIAGAQSAWPASTAIDQTHLQQERFPGETLFHATETQRFLFLFAHECDCGDFGRSLQRTLVAALNTELEGAKEKHHHRHYHHQEVNGDDRAAPNSPNTRASSLGFAKRLARLRLLGRFLGLVVSLPHWPLSRMLETDKLEQQTATATQTQTAATAAAAATPSSTSAVARPSISISSSSTDLPSPSSVSPSVASISAASSATIPPRRAASSSLQVAAEADAEIEGSAEAERDASGAAARRALLQEAVAELSAATSPPPFMHIYADSSGAESGADWCSMMMAAGAEGFAPLAHLRDACARGEQGHMHPTLPISPCAHVSMFVSLV